MNAYLPAFSLMLLGTIVLVLAQLMPTPEMRQVGVLYPAGHKFIENYAEAVAAGGRVVRAGAYDNLLVVDMEAPQSLKELYAHGALLVFNPQILGYCYTKPL